MASMGGTIHSRGSVMPKNILIFSDGTGQAGGLLVDENRSNVYKLYRATRVGPDFDNRSGAAACFLRSGPRFAV